MLEAALVRTSFRHQSEAQPPNGPLTAATSPDTPSTTPATQSGRRGGKSRALATFAAYISGLAEHPSLVPGERGVVLCIAPDTRQASIALEYCAAAFEQSPILRSLIVGRTTDTLSLSNGVDIEVRAASFRRLRGPTYVAVIADEAAFWTTASRFGLTRFRNATKRE
jgi:hypothetical protein